MKAIANLEFDEKAVAVEKYMDRFSDKSFDSKLLDPEYKKFLWDLRAMAHVTRWASKEGRREVRVRLNAIISHLEGMMNTRMLDEVKSLCGEFWPEMAEAKAVDKIIEQGNTISGVARTMEPDDARALLSSTQVLRTHWSGVIVTLIGYAVVLNVATWSYFLKAYVDSLEITPQPLYIGVASALSSIIIMLWRLYTI